MSIFGKTRRVYLVCRREGIQFLIVGIADSERIASVMCDDEHSFYFEMQMNAEVSGEVKEIYPCREVSESV